MGFNKQTSNKKVLFFNLKNEGKLGDMKEKRLAGNPYFQIWEMQDDKRAYTQESRDVAGLVREVKIVEKEKEDGEKYEVCEIVLDDDEGTDERYIVQVPFTMIGRSIVNTIVGYTGTINKMMISVYTNKKGQKSVFMQINDEKCGRKYGKDEMAKLIEKKKGVNTKGEDIDVRVTKKFIDVLKADLENITLENPRNRQEEEKEAEEAKQEEPVKTTKGKKAKTMEDEADDLLF